MARKLIIFGNGLGMAIDPIHFSLSQAMSDIWHMPEVLPEAQKQLICRCTDSDGEPPTGEDQLDILHQAVTACSTLNNIARDEIHWLSEDGQRFPEAIARYLHKVAIRLHNYEADLNEDFFKNLADFVKATRSHVATLNYDRLIYSYFIDHGVLAGYNGALIDGMVNDGFAEHRLERRFGRDFGYYLHLHGSPLFIEHLGTIYKLQRNQLTLDTPKFSTHLVLTHVKHKISAIHNSPLLSVYWKYLNICLIEVDEVIIFGYSGNDSHLNLVLSSFGASKKIRIVEWAGAGDLHARTWFWSQRLNIENPEVTQLNNITDFRDW